MSANTVITGSGNALSPDAKALPKHLIKTDFFLNQIDIRNTSKWNSNQKSKNVIQKKCRWKQVSKIWSTLTVQLTHWALDKMAAISQTTFWNTLSWMKITVLLLKFYWIMFSRVKYPDSSIDSDDDLPPNRQQAMIWMNGGLVYWSKYASHGPSELITNNNKW